MKIKNIQGEISFSPKEEAKQEAKQVLSELKKKRPTTLKEVAERLEVIEKILGI